jgi:hypothetical protein
MASKTVTFKKSRFYSLHRQLDENFIRKFLLPELKKQGLLGLGSLGIELPTGELITLGEAKDLVFDYLINDANLGERDQRTLRGVVSFTSFVSLADSYLNREISAPQTMASVITPDQLSTLQYSKAKTIVNAPSRFSSDQTVRDYNTLYLKILSLSTASDPSRILARLFPGGISSATDITQLALAQVIVSNLPQLKNAANLSTDSTEQHFLVARELSQIIKYHSNLVGYRNFLGNDAIQATLHQYVESVSQEAEKVEPQAIEKLTRLQIEYGKKLKEYLPNTSELRTQIYNSLPSNLISQTDRAKLTDQILRETIKNSLDGASLETILADLQINAGLQQQISQSFRQNGISLSLEYQQGEIRFLADSHELTSYEKNLIKRGISPFLTTQNPNDDRFVKNSNKLLSDYNSRSGQPKEFITLQEAYEYESQKAQPDVLFLLHARDHLNRTYYYNSLPQRDQLRVRIAHGRSWISRTTNRLRNAQDKFIDSIYDITDTVAGKKWLYNQWDRWEKIVSKINVPGTQIPIFRINNWIIDQYQSWKKTRVVEWIGKSSSWSGPFGKWTHQRLKDYKLGSFTLGGMTSVGIHRTWSNFAYKASGKIIKGGLIASERTLRRLLIKVGGKALAKLTFEAVATLSGIFTVVGVLSIAKDVLDLVGGVFKWGWEQLKKLFGSSEGALAAVITGATVWIAGAWTIGTTFLLGLFSSFILPGVVSAAWAIGIALGALYLFTHQGGDGFNMSIHLDSGSSLVQNIAISVLCEDNSNAPSSRAACLAKYLNQCYGGSITASNVSRGLSCLATYAIAPGAIDEVERSASGNLYLQCVGFVKAVASWVGTSIGSHNACGYVDDPRFVSGLGGVKQGDAIVFKSSGTCSNEAPGHIGILKEDAGANVCLIDANYRCKGCVTDGNCLPKTNIAGYLKL